MNGSDVLTVFRYNAFVIGRTLEGIDDATARRSPPGGGNALSWVFGHIVTVRDEVLRRIGGERVLTAEEAEIYARGAGPLEESEGLELAALAERFEASQGRLTAGLEPLDDAACDVESEPSPVGPQWAITIRG